MHPILSAIATSFFLAIIRNRDAFSNYSVKIKALSVAFPAFKLISVKIIDRFSAVFSASAKSLI
jgi:hypothetical protein